MSLLAVQGGATGTGTVTLLAPITNTNRTITLPDETGTVLTTATAGVPVNGPAFNVYNSSQQSITSSTFTKLQFNTEVFDTNSNFDSTTNYRFTPTVAGYYQFSWYFAPASTTTSSLCRLYKNGSFLYGPFAGNNVSNSLSGGSALVYMNGSTDYVEVYGYLVGTTPVVESGQNWTLFCGALVRSAV